MEYQLIKKSYLILSCLLYAYVSMAEIESVWIDTDISIGKWGKDVDDGIALIMVLQSDQIHLEGISFTEDVNYAYQVTQKLIGWYQPDQAIPLFKGAKDASELGSSNQAVEALAQTLRRQKLTILALGPATNIATLLQLYPELKPQIKRIIWCAGRTPGLHFYPGRGKIAVCDCNFDHDPTGGEILLASGVKVVLSGYEPAAYIYLSRTDIAPLQNSLHPADQWVYQQLNNWLNLWRIVLGSEKGFIPFDAVTVGSFLYPEAMYFYEQVPVTVKEQKNDVPFSIFKPRKPCLIASYEIGSSSKADYCYKAASDYKQIILHLLIRHLPDETPAN